MYEDHIKHCNSTVKQHRESIRLINLKIRDLEEIVNKKHWLTDDIYLTDKRSELERLLKEKDTMEFHLSRGLEILRFWKSQASQKEILTAV